MLYINHTLQFDELLKWKMYHVDKVLYACTFTDSNFTTFTLFSKKKQPKKQTKNKDKLSYYSLWEASHLALPFLEKSIFVYQQIYSEGIIWKERNSLSNGTVHVTLATKFMATFQL